MSWEYYSDGIKTLTHTFFLRDDSYLRDGSTGGWSLFCDTSDFYGRIIIFGNTTLARAVEMSEERIKLYFDNEFDLCKI